MAERGGTRCGMGCRLRDSLSLSRTGGEWVSLVYESEEGEVLPVSGGWILGGLLACVSRSVRRSDGGWGSACLGSCADRPSVETAGGWIGRKISSNAWSLVLPDGGSAPDPAGRSRGSCTLLSAGLARSWPVMEPYLSARVWE